MTKVHNTIQYKIYTKMKIENIKIQATFFINTIYI